MKNLNNIIVGILVLVIVILVIILFTRKCDCPNKCDTSDVKADFINDISKINTLMKMQKFYPDLFDRMYSENPYIINELYIDPDLKKIFRNLISDRDYFLNYFDCLLSSYLTSKPETGCTTKFKKSIENIKNITPQQIVFFGELITNLEVSIMHIIQTERPGGGVVRSSIKR